MGGKKKKKRRYAETRLLNVQLAKRRFDQVKTRSGSIRNNEVASVRECAMQSFLTRRRSNPVRIRRQTSTLDLPATVSCAVHLAENYGNNNFMQFPRCVPPLFRRPSRGRSGTLRRALR